MRFRVVGTGTITAGGTLGILIPPSIMLVVMGPVLEVPVTDLFAAAILPGVLLAVLYIVYSVGRCWLNPNLGPILPEADFETGSYELIFFAGDYLRRHGATGEVLFLDQVPIRFGMSEDAHSHVPLLLSPFGYSTYRGS